MVKLRESIIFFTLLFVAGVLIYSYQNIQTIKETTVSKIESHEVGHLESFASNIQRHLQSSYNIKDATSLYDLMSDDATRERFEQSLGVILSKHIIYAYMLQMDSSGKFRFLLDASSEDKASFYEKFDAESELYKDVYEDKKARFKKQQGLKNIYITYAYPIVIDGETIALLSFDLSTELQYSILKQIAPLERFFIVLSIIVVIFLLISIIQFINYLITRKRIFIDPLTQVYNRSYLEEILTKLDLKNYSLALIDLDKFKLINDTYGHQAGDSMLREVASIIKASLRESDIFVRYGGEEFLLLIYTRGDAILAEEIANRVRKNISSKIFHINDHELKITVSMGLHASPSYEKNIQEAIKTADIALYRAKSNGRNRIEIFSESFKGDTHKEFVLECIKDAINLGKVLCHYQPVYDAKDKKIIKYEALVRIYNKEDRLVMPNEFLPYIKGTNLYYKITKRVLEIVINNIKTELKSISMNISFSDLMDSDIFEMITEHLQESHLPKNIITFEILESDEISNTQLFKERVLALQSLGAKISIDDFGSGYSNFRLVLDSEANYLKIDGDLIKNIDKNEKDFKVVDSIVHFAKNSHMKTIAEFVHSKEVYDKLIELGIDYMQGYYISPPKEHLASEDELFKN